MRRQYYMAKRGFAFLLAFVLLFGGLDLPALAAQDNAEGSAEGSGVFSLVSEEPVVMDAGVEIGNIGSNGEFAWSYDAGTGTLTVSGTGELNNRSSSPLLPVFEGRNIQKLTFEGCVLQGSAQRALANLPVAEMDLTGLDTSQVTNMSGLFLGCSSLTSLDVSGLKTGSATDMSQMFLGCSALISLDISHFDTGNVTDMYSMFDGCGNLVSLDLGEIKTDNVQYMHYMFDGCSSLASLDVSHFNTGNVVRMSGMFLNCNSLTSLDVSKFNTEKVEGMAVMFSGCHNLPVLDVSHFKTDNVESIEGMFEDCRSLTSLDVSGFNTANMTEMNSVFSGCRNLVALDVSHFDTGKVQEMNDLFSGCCSLTSLDVSQFKTGNVQEMSRMFFGCSSLTSLDVSHFNTQNVYEMNSMFGGCRNLTSLDLSNFDTAGVWEMNYMFNGCSSLTSLDVTHFNTSQAESLEGMFKNCSSLSSLDLSNFDTTKVTEIDEMLQGCDSLNRISVPRVMGDYTCELPYLFYDESDKDYKTLPGRGGVEEKLVLTRARRFEAYKVCYDGNDETSGIMTDQYIEVGKKWNLNANTFKKDGFGFEGWNTASDKSGDAHEDREAVINLAGTGDSVTLFAQWGPVKYTLRFHGVGATAGSMEDRKGCLYGASYDIPANKFIRSGYSFVGWNTKPDGSGTPYQTGDSVSFEGTEDGRVIFLYAQWEELANKVIYILYGGQNHPNNPAAYDAETSDVALAAPTREGYTFGGWYRDAAFTDPMAAIPQGSTGKVTVYAKWTPNQYTIRFNGNGTADVSMGDMKCTYGMTYSLPANTYQKNGYSFVCWKRDPNGSGKGFSDRANVSSMTEVPDGIVTFYAQWAPTTYVIRYDLDGGISLTANPAGYNIESDPVTFSDPVKLGYTFGGWYSDRTFAKKVTEIPKGSTGDMTLCAKWLPNVYVVKFDGNKATEGTMAVMEGCVYGQWFNLPENAFRRKGYTFTGWNTREDGSGISYGDKENVGNLTAIDNWSVVLYAQWSAVKYTITYNNMDGATNHTSNPSGYAEDAAAITLGAPVKTGYTFDGWYSDAAFTGKVEGIPAGSSGDKVFYAKWIVNKYSISFDGNGSTEGSMAEMKDLDYGTKYTLTENAFSRAGYAFAGWNSKADGSGMAYTDKMSVEDLSAENGANVKLYAQWTKMPGKYAIAYSLNGGTNAASNPDCYDETTTPVTLADPVREGYDFAGWYSDTAYKNRVTELKSTDTGNLVLRAKWTAHSYTISFDGNGGSGSMKAMANRAYGTAYELSANKFKKDGAVFIGWGSSAGGTEAAYRDCDRVKDLTAENGGSVTLYARWLDLAANNAYSITYRLNGGANDPANPSYYTEGSAVALKAPTKPGYRFDGWYAKSNLKGGKTESIDANSKGNKTLYAKWVPLTYTIKFNGNPTGITQGNSKATSGAGGKVENSMADITNAKTGKKVTLKANKFKYNGYTFAGWNTKPDGSGVAVKNKAGVKDLCLGEDGAFQDTVTLYAQWTETKYAITYKLNKGKLPTDTDSGSGATAASCPKSYTIGSDTITLAAPTRSGYTFDGWYTTKKCREGTKIDTIPAGSTGKLTLYAKWVKNK